MTKKRHIGNLLFALNIFIAFLLLFENKLVIPLWLQPVGRMHPLILHFPIVLLLLAAVMEFLRPLPDAPSNPFYHRFTSALLLAGVITSGMAVVMGVFLSQEGGYSPAVLSWHKLSGASVFFIASTIYTWRNARWYSIPLARAGAVVIAVALIVAGHCGGALTHGDNFIWQPVLVKQKHVAPLEEALVFDDVVRPVLESKCTGCHNANKLKGQLMLTDSAAILRGGKTGGVLVVGDPQRSLLIRRIHLHEAEKKHMPPSGKPQLTETEKQLLYSWIQSGALFNTPVVALPESDPLRVAATKMLAPDDHVEVFPFSAADGQVIENLNSNYRVIKPVALNSPALAVNIYNKEVYTPHTIEELKAISAQVISLDAGKMPVRNEDVRYITLMENLRELNLNFTEITGEALQALAGLEHLTDLSLSGTKVGYADLLRYLPRFKDLRTLAIWDTQVSQTEIGQLQRAFNKVAILGGVNWNERPLMKLNPPRLKNKIVVFEDSISIDLDHPVNGVDIRFTTDGAEPDSLSSKLFHGHAVLKETTVIHARAYKQGWLRSDVTALTVYSSRHKPDSAILLCRLNRVHTANGAQTFFDHQLGSFNANSPAWANNWAGVINNDLAVLLRFDSARAVSSVSLNTLIETENFIFPPAVVEIWGGSTESTLHLMHRCRPSLPTAYRKPFIRLYECQFQAHKVSYLKIVAKPVRKIPAWHKRKNGKALLLIDEILVN